MDHKVVAFQRLTGVLRYGSRTDGKAHGASPDRFFRMKWLNIRCPASAHIHQI